MCLCISRYIVGKQKEKLEILAAILGLVMKSHAKYNENPSMATG
jgi:hypothetical protein